VFVFVVGFVVVELELLVLLLLVLLLLLLFVFVFVLEFVLDTFVWRLLPPIEGGLKNEANKPGCVCLGAGAETEGTEEVELFDDGITALDEMEGKDRVDAD
jgi:hypothetical protein